MQVQPLAATLPGVGTLAGTLSTTGGVSLSVTMAGVGTLAGTLSLSTALSTTMAAVGTLAGTLSAHLPLPSTSLGGVGTLAGRPSTDNRPRRVVVTAVGVSWAVS